MGLFYLFMYVYIDRVRVGVKVSWRARTTHQPAPTGISQSKAKRVQEYVVAGRCLLMWLARAH